jgi:hypothetical protein
MNETNLQSAFSKMKFKEKRREKIVISINFLNKDGITLVNKTLNKIDYK